MTTTLNPPAATRPTAASGRSLGILAALGGRFGWRYWIATAVWLVVGLITAAYLHIVQPRDAYGPLHYTALPAGLYLIAYLLGVALIWVWGARFAISLGHRRGAVYGWAWLASLLLGGWVWLSTQLANHAEMAIVGRQTWRAFTVEAGDNKFGTETAVFNLSFLLVAAYLTPILVLWVTMLAGFVGRGLLGALIGLAAGLASVVFGRFVPLTYLDGVIPPVFYSNGGSLLVAGALHLAICATVGWLLFRKARG